MTDQLKPETDEVRQGETGHGVRYMLIVGLILVVIAFGVVAMFTLQPTGQPMGQPTGQPTGQSTGVTLAP